MTDSKRGRRWHRMGTFHGVPQLRPPNVSLVRRDFQTCIRSSFQESISCNLVISLKQELSLFISFPLPLCLSPSFSLPHTHKHLENLISAHCCQLQFLCHRILGDLFPIWMSVGQHAAAFMPLCLYAFMRRSWQVDVKPKQNSPSKGMENDVNLWLA